MYCAHFGLQTPPFRITPQTEAFFAGAQRGSLLEALLFAIHHDEGIIRLSGEVGTGKTMLCRMLIERLPPETLIIYIANPSLSPAELIATVAHELEIDTANGHGLLRQIEYRLIGLYGQGLRVITIIDEAHAMPRESLDQIRLLSNLETGTRKLMQIVLFGQPELDAILAERPMRSLRERITQNFVLSPLDSQQVRDYLDFRLRSVGYHGPDLFTGTVLRRIAQASQGLTRRVNIIADKTLLAAFADNTHTLSERHVSAAIHDAGYRNHRLPQYKTLLGIASSVLAGTLILLAPRLIPARTSAPAVESVSHAEQVTKVLPKDQSTTSHTPSERPLLAGYSDRYAPVPEQLGPLARERLATSRADMDHIADSQWFIQLRSIPAANASTLESFLPSANKAIDPAQLRLFVVKNDPKQTIGVIYGAYASSKEAYANLAKLPNWIKAGGAFARPYKTLRADNKKATANAAASAPSTET